LQIEPGRAPSTVKAFGRVPVHGFAAVRKSVENITAVHDVHATVLQLLGLDHKKLTYRFGGRDVSLTDVHGTVIRDILV
jgi:hypothetical protein